jgi:hypothetical protein
MANDCDISDWPTADICLDLIAYAADCANANIEELSPLVQAWKDRRCITS